MADEKKQLPMILVIDDDLTIRKFVEKTFSEIGYRVLSAGSAQQGLGMIAEESPALIILDVILPDMDGFDVLKRLKTTPATACIPVIMLTMKKFDEDIQLGLDLGAEDYVSKPLHAGLLVKRVENVFNKS